MKPGMINAADPVMIGNKTRSFSQFQLSDFYSNQKRILHECILPVSLYRRHVKKTADPIKLFKIVVFGMMKKIYSARGLQEACRKNIDFMFLLDGSPVPDHATFARFVSDHFSKCSEKTMSEMTLLLKEQCASDRHTYSDTFSP